jgi:hypothetical protein
MENKVFAVLLKDGEPMQCGYDKYEEFDKYTDYLNIMYPEHKFHADFGFLTVLDKKK